MKNAAPPKLRPPVKRHGGKAYLARRIVPLLPSHRVYVEPFVGGGSVLLNKPRSAREVAGDLDGRLVALWLAIRDRPDELAEAVAGIGYTEANFEDARTPYPGPLGAAAAYLVRNRFSRGGLGETFAWSERLRGGQPGDANAWDTIRAGLPVIASRVRGIEFLRMPALDLIGQHDGDETTIYADPPYHHDARTARSAYEHEMTDHDHAALLALLASCRSSVVLSGYRCDLYDTALAGWDRKEFDMPNHSGQGVRKQRRTECVWVKG